MSEEQIAQSTSQSAGVQPRSGLAKNPMSWFARFTLFATFILAGCGIALAGFLYQQLIQNSPLEKAMIENSAARTAISESLEVRLFRAEAAMELRQMASQDKLSETIEERLSQAEETLQTGLELVTASKPTTPKKWRLAEAGYLVREANRRLMMQRDSELALLALANAEQILQDLGEFAPFALRAKLADDIASLQRINTVDLEATYIRLETLKSDVPNGFPSQKIIASKQSANTQQVEAWWQQILNRLESLIKISMLVEQAQSQELPKLLPSREVAKLANLRIKLSLEQAQLALLQGQQQIFRASLLQAKQTAEEYFDTSELGAKNLLAEIEVLSALVLKPELTDLSSLLVMMSNLEAGRE